MPTKRPVRQFHSCSLRQAGTRQTTLEGQTHDVNLAILAPVLVEFFNG